MFYYVPTCSVSLLGYIMKKKKWLSVNIVIAYVFAFNYESNLHIKLGCEQKI